MEAGEDMEEEKDEDDEEEEDNEFSAESGCCGWAAEKDGTSDGISYGCEMARLEFMFESVIGLGFGAWYGFHAS